jgi:hypothetical protein
MLVDQGSLVRLGERHSHSVDPHCVTEQESQARRFDPRLASEVSHLLDANAHRIMIRRRPSPRLMTMNVTIEEGSATAVENTRA